MTKLFEAALENRDTRAISELVLCTDTSALGAKGCEAAVLLGDEELMRTCIKQLTEPEADFWMARTDLLSGEHTSAITISLAALDKTKPSSLSISLCRGIANALSDLGLWEESMTILRSLMDNDLVSTNNVLLVKVLTDLFRARCRASLSVQRISDSVEEIVFEEVDQWREQIFSLELKKWALIWQLEGSDLAPRAATDIDLRRVRKINDRFHNRFSPMIMSTIEALGLLCADHQDIAHDKLTKVVKESKSQPYCYYLAFEAVRIAQRYIGVECPLVLANKSLVARQETQAQNVRKLLAESSTMGKVLKTIQAIQ
ncbi:hypothetical protein [Tabrizicola sp. BL-A-41-H6]|uniref:hypothetical protein n=1 Tax=Tabrizicola sp. BL-A-41-H6 TaxID=3421107 RepID=UPI003D67D6F1